MIKIVLDTNCLLRSISRRSQYRSVLEKLSLDKYELCVTGEILLEYEEKLSQIFSKEIAELVLGVFSLLDNVKKIDVHYNLNLISSDYDDNKFVDCAFAGNANYLVTEDRHFNVLKQISFPSINVISLNEFRDILDTL